MSLRLFVSAGESSGDRHAAALVRALRARVGPVEVRGLGGSALEAEGASLLARTEELSVLGFSAVARRFPFFVRLMRRATAEIERWNPHVVLPVDYPGFNLRLSRRARARGFPVLYYIAPQVWAWRRDRRPGIARAVDRLLVVFPFEEELFREAGIDAVFVGHPLLDHPPDPAEGPRLRRELGIPAEAPLLALLPGSRRQEVELILPPLVEGAKRLASKGVRTVVSRVEGVDTRHYAAALQAGIPLREGRVTSLVSAADAALVASGTATLETGLVGTPLAVVYRGTPFNWLIARAVVKVRTIGLVNIAAGGNEVPELLQENLTAEKVEETARRLLFDRDLREAQTRYLAGLRRKLGEGGAAERAAEEVARAMGAPQR